jgi:RimJ/RimL family protein N-acetyltransferase
VASRTVLRATDNALVPETVGPVVEPGSLAATEQPVLETYGLVLRPWRADDVPVLASAYSDPEIGQWHARTMDEREAREWVRVRRERWRGETGGDWAVTEDDGAVIGRMGFRRLELAAGLGEVAYWVLPEARGRGVARRALCALTDWAFDRLGLHRLELLHATGNVGSCRVAQTAGFAVEGTLRQLVLHADGWHDMHVHARLAGDPPPDPRRPTQ